MIKKQSYISNSTLKKNLFNDYTIRSELNNDQRLTYMDDDRYLISDYTSSNNLGKFFKTRHTNFFSYMNLANNFIDDDF